MDTIAEQNRAGIKVKCYSCCSYIVRITVSRKFIVVSYCMIERPILDVSVTIIVLTGQSAEI